MLYNVQKVKLNLMLKYIHTVILAISDRKSQNTLSKYVITDDLHRPGFSGGPGGPGPRPPTS